MTTFAHETMDPIMMGPTMGEPSKRSLRSRVLLKLAWLRAHQWPLPPFWAVLVILCCVVVLVWKSPPKYTFVCMTEVRKWSLFLIERKINKINTRSSEVGSSCVTTPILQASGRVRLVSTSPSTEIQLWMHGFFGYDESALWRCPSTPVILSSRTIILL